MTQTASDFSVIICAYTEKRWNELVAAVESIQRQTVPPKEIIVVIDSNPNLLLRAQKNLSGVVAIENFKAKGASGSRNSGGTTAQGDILAFLDDDAIAMPDWIEKLALCYTSPKVAGVGGKIEPLWKAKRPSWFPDEFNWVVGCSYQGMPTTNVPIPVRNLIGANMSVRRHILISLGGFRESFGNNKNTNTARTRLDWLHHRAGDEETEFCIRVTRQLPGSEWLYTILAVVQHQVPLERTRWAYFLWRCYDEGLGKANLVKLHDTQKALSSERTYTFKALPKGIARGLADALLHWDLTGLARVGAIVTGLAMTTAGYLIGSISLQVAGLRNASLVTASQPRTAEQSPPVEV